FAATRYETKGGFGGNSSFTTRSALGHVGFGYMCTDHFELAGALGGGRAFAGDGAEGSVNLIDGHLKPMWHFLPRHRVDPYVGLRLGVNSWVGESGHRLDFLAGGPVMGVNYFLNRRVSIYAESGYSYSHPLHEKSGSLQ